MDPFGLEPAWQRKNRSAKARRVSLGACFTASDLQHFIVLASQPVSAGKIKLFFR
jgi:hypothetical protein